MHKSKKNCDLRFAVTLNLKPGRKTKKKEEWRIYGNTVR